VQKLELFFDQESPNLRQFLTWLAYRPSATVDLLVRNGFDAAFPANPSFGRLSPQFKSFNFDAFETSPV
jgi:hypothetical protein